MKCPFCGYTESKVIDSRPTDDGTNIRRRRECISCGKRFTTYEKVEHIPIMVVKKDKSRQPFDPDKMLNGLLRACEKRPISASQLRGIVDKIENDIYSSAEREITTEQIGEKVMQELKGLDDVAYVRFASVYRQFKDINTFIEELNNILGDKKIK